VLGADYHISEFLWLCCLFAYFCFGGMFGIYFVVRLFWVGWWLSLLVAVVQTVDHFMLVLVECRPTLPVLHSTASQSRRIWSTLYLVGLKCRWSLIWSSSDDRSSTVYITCSVF